MVYLTIKTGCDSPFCNSQSRADIHVVNVIITTDRIYVRIFNGYWLSKYNVYIIILQVKSIYDLFSF